MNGYPRGFPALLYAITAVLVATGCLLVPRALEQRLEWTVPWTLSGGQNIATGALHVSAAFLMILLVGALWPVHMRRYWWAKRNRRSGSTFAAVWGVLLLTSIGVLYLGDERLSLLNSAVHSIVGLAVPVVFAVHVLRGWRSREERPRKSNRDLAEADPKRMSSHG